eukprot:comp21943_c0_seq1/m.31618 comp21943_c0_seq1/g.31618  ORF comp21943_c0_seq1/g.31618 comp21943_c0_seq1/m.31618 type:complete len:578 (-) comp21943_c0_seq1:39-1772(-)
MPNIPYPEFKDFHLKLSRTKVPSDKRVEGYAFVSMNDLPNCVKDILIAIRCCFRYYAQDGSLATVLIHEDIQRNATPFDDEGIPEGEYEFPFSFMLPTNLPCSVTVAGGIEPSLNCKVWYEVRAYVMHKEDHPTLERKHLRTSARFQRLRAENPVFDVSQSPLKDYSFSKLSVRACLDKNVYHPGEPIKITIEASHEHVRGIHAIKISVRQLVKARKKMDKNYVELAFKNTVAHTDAWGKGVPLRKGLTLTRQVAVSPVYDEYAVSLNYGGIGLAGQLTQDEKPHLAPTTTRGTEEGIEVSYAVHVSFCVYLASDVTITMPFTMADCPATDDDLPDYEEGYDESEAARAKRLEAEAAGAWEPQAPHDPDMDGPDENGDLPPAFDEVMARKSLYRPVGKFGDRKSRSRTTIRMRNTRILGSTDDFANTVNAGNEAQTEEEPTQVKPMPGITEGNELASEISQSLKFMDEVCDATSSSLAPPPPMEAPRSGLIGMEMSETTITSTIPIPDTPTSPPSNVPPQYQNIQPTLSGIDRESVCTGKGETESTPPLSPEPLRAPSTEQTSVGEVERTASDAQKN